MNKYVYTTLLSSLDYLPAVLILNESLKRVNSKYPLFVIVTEDVAQEAEYYLKQELIQYKIVPVIRYHKQVYVQYADNTVINTASKLSILSLYEYDKIVYIDSDAIIYKNIDHLFNYSDGSILKETDTNLSALMVLSPKNHELKYYYTLLQCFPELDGDLFEKMLFPAKSNEIYQIPMQYFLNIMLNNLSVYSINEIYAIHFCFKYKPWKYQTSQEYLNDYHLFAPQDNSELRITIIEKYMQEYLYPLWEKYPEFMIYCKNN